MLHIRSFLLAFVVILAAPWAQAAAYKCTDVGGNVTYSDLPCPVTVAKDQKVLGRGAGSNPLTDEEKTAFKRGVLRNCALPRMVCNCVAETMAEQLTYEEVMQTMRSNGAYTGSILEKRSRALNACEKMAAVR
ncbi:MAG: hypothetical protein CFE44_02270 [Burkholderiales bacterium PBB4]|nr:MAG: hypothetical protein CFE44_02270 [Burkholderiales bacterium PBB4]